jgi:L-fuconolactonase
MSRDDEPLSRRAFLTEATAAAALLSAQARADGPKEKDEFPIVDTHQHLWDLDKFKLLWLKDHLALAKSYRPADYQKEADNLAVLKDPAPPAKVVKTVYMEVDVAPEQQQAEADWVVGVCKEGKTVMVAAVVSGRPASDGFAKYAGQFKDSKYVKGIRQVLHQTAPAGYCLDKKFIAGIRRLGELGLRFDLCMRAAELPDAAKLIDACPDTRFILDHCGNADVKAKERTQWQKDMADLAKRKNVVGKVSGIVASAPPGKWKADDLAPIVNHTLEVFGPERVMFGGDWPVCTAAASLAQWVAALRSIVKDHKEAEQRKLFHDNAVRFYGL